MVGACFSDMILCETGAYLFRSPLQTLKIKQNLEALGKAKLASKLNFESKIKQKLSFFTLFLIFSLHVTKVFERLASFSNPEPSFFKKTANFFVTRLSISLMVLKSQRFKKKCDHGLPYKSGIHDVEIVFHEQ